MLGGWGLCVFVIEFLRRLWVFSVVVLTCKLHLELTFWCMTSQVYVYLVVNNTKPAACKCCFNVSSALQSSRHQITTQEHTK